MYVTSSQKRVYTFIKDQDLVNLRAKCNEEYILQHCEGIDVSTKLLYFTGNRFIYNHIYIINYSHNHRSI